MAGDQDRLKLAVEILPNEPISNLINEATVAEQHSFSFLWVPDHFTYRDVFITLAILGSRTKRVRIGPGITSPYIRHPVTLASSIGSLDELTGGRMVLGIGPGDRTSLDKLGLSYEKPVAKIRSCIETIRRLLSLPFEGDQINSPEPRLSFAVRQVPIYLGAQGPNMLKLAGEIADGVLINASHPQDIENAVKYVREGLSLRGDNPSLFDIGAFTLFSIDEDLTRAKKVIRPVIVYVVDHLLPEQKQQILDQDPPSKELFNALTKRDYKEANNKVSDFLIEKFSITGTPRGCLEKLVELQKIGINQVVIGSPLGKDRTKAIQLVGSAVIPSLLQ